MNNTCRRRCHNNDPWHNGNGRKLAYRNHSLSAQPQRFGLCRFIIVLFFLSTGINNAATADTIWLTDRADPIFGIVESETSDSIVFRQTEDGKQFQSVTFDRRKIETMVINHDDRRLQELHPVNLSEYFEYAEELVPQKQDPVARNLAIRLLVIVVHNSNDLKLRRSALDHLVFLSRTDEERKRLETVRFIETGVQLPPESSDEESLIPTEQQRIAAAELVRSIRQRKPVSDRIQKKQLKTTLEFYNSICSWDELILISKSNRIDNRQLRRLVSLERQLLASPDELNLMRSRKEAWDALAKRVVSNRIVIPSIETATEFKPNDSLFVDGKWITRTNDPSREPSDQN